MASNPKRPREWPNVARQYRDEAAMTAHVAAKRLRQVVRGVPMTDLERLRYEALALDALEKIARLMEAAGAPTRPTE